MDHILLTSEEQPEAAKRTTQRRFVQAAELKGYRASFEIFNQRYVDIQVRKMVAKPSAYRVDLGILEAQPERCRIIDWPLFGAAGALLATTVLISLYLHYSATPVLSNGWLPTVIITAAGAWIFALFGMQRSSDTLVFHSKHGRYPLVELLNNKPNRAAFQEFLQDLEAHIQRARERAQSGDRELLAAELREHRRLKDEGIIGASEYEAVKARILHSHAGS